MILWCLCGKVNGSSARPPLENKYHAFSIFFRFDLVSSPLFATTTSISVTRRLVVLTTRLKRERNISHLMVFVLFNASSCHFPSKVSRLHAFSPYPPGPSFTSILRSYSLGEISPQANLTSINNQTTSTPCTTLRITLSFIGARSVSFHLNLSF